MCTSRKQTSGWSASNCSIASRPLRACATTSSSGHACASWRARASRSSGSSSAISAVGRAARHAAPRAGRSSSAQTPSRLLRGHAQLRVAAEVELKALAQRRRGRCRARCPSGRRPDAGVADAHHGSGRRAAARGCRCGRLPRSGRCRGAPRSPPASAASSADSAAPARRLIDVQRELQAIGHAHVHQLEVRPDQLQLLAERGGRLVAGAARPRAGRRSGCRSTAAACGDPASTSACTLASVLNRKCGATCACSRRRRASTPLRSSLRSRSKASA